MWKVSYGPKQCHFLSRGKNVIPEPETLAFRGFVSI